MRWGVVRAGDDQARRTARSVVDDQPGWTVTFGNDVFVYAANDRFDAVASAVEQQGFQLPEAQPDRRVAKADLHLVTQVGAAFTTANPDVPVLHDAGRWLVVELSPEQAAELDDHDYRIESLEPDSVVFTTASPPVPDWAARHGDLAARLDSSRIQVDIGHMVSFGTRHSSSPQFTRAADWLVDRLGDLGLDVTLMPVELPGGQSSANVVAHKEGVGTDRGLVVVGAHLDSVNHVDGPEGPAPGADDNASGAATVLELARLLATEQCEHDVAFLLYGGEEQGLHGSRAHVASLDDADRERLVAMVNMDMVAGMNTQSPTVLVESSQEASALADVLAGAAAATTDLVVQRSTSPFGSDHVPYLDEGLPAALTIEGADSSNEVIHTSGDVITHIHIHLAERIARANLVAIAHLAGRHQAPAPASGAGSSQPDSTSAGGPTQHAAPGAGGAAAADVHAQLARHVDELLAAYGRVVATGRTTAGLVVRQHAMVDLRMLLGHASRATLRATRGRPR